MPRILATIVATWQEFIESKPEPFGELHHVANKIQIQGG
jgi:hypothetical protein